jgi:hypothetical protein
MALEPQAGVQWVQSVSLFSTAEPGTLQVDPVLTAGDFLLYQNNVLIGNLTTLPVTTPAGSRVVLLTVTAGEMIGLRVDVVGHDPDGTWGDIHVPLRLAQTSGDARAQVAAEAALVTHRLDELLAADSDIDGAQPPAVGSVFHELLTKTASSFTYDQTTDSLEAVRDRGDAAWVTGAAGTNPFLLQTTTIATLASQTSFTLTAGSTDTNAYNGCVAVVTDAVTAVQKAVGTVLAYTGSTKTVTLKDNPGVFTMAVGDTIDLLADRSLKPTVDNRTLDVTATGAAGIDWANVENPTTALNLSATNIDVDQVVAWNAAWDAEVQSEVNDALVAQRLDELVNADSDINGAQPPTVGSVVHDMLSKTLGSFTYNAATDSLEALRDKAADIEADTQDIQGHLPSALTGAGNMKSDAVALDGSTTAATNLKSSALAVYVGTITGAATTTTLIDSGLTQSGATHWDGKILTFVTGVLAKQSVRTVSFSPGADQLTFTAATAAPSGGDVYVIH